MRTAAAAVFSILLGGIVLLGGSVSAQAPTAHNFANAGRRPEHF
jgi:hypothetical protein